MYGRLMAPRMRRAHPEHPVVREPPHPLYLFSFSCCFCCRFLPAYRRYASISQMKREAGTEGMRERGERKSVLLGAF